MAKNVYPWDGSLQKTEKYLDGWKVVKARLVVRGFEEADILQLNSPTCCRDSPGLASSIMVSKGWKCDGIDVWAAFLQGK